jgi:ParB-like chromosome segregation protein Spo0J
LNDASHLFDPAFCLKIRIVSQFALGLFSRSVCVVEIAFNFLPFDIQIDRWPIERLIPRANNPRTHGREQVASIAASMREWGWTNPILVGSDDDIIAGHARLLAAEKLAMKEVPVIVLRHPSPAQRRTLVIADNQLAIAGAAWDEEMLRIELAILHE